MKKLIVFDLDSTLAESKSPLDEEMAALLGTLLETVEVAIISGADWPQFEKQVLMSSLSENKYLDKLSLLPTCGTKFYRYQSGWKLLYSENFTGDEKENIIDAFQQIISTSSFEQAKVWGKLIEDRGSQMTFSALGQQAPIEERKKWDPDLVKRKTIKASLDHLIPQYSISFGGTTSIDVTKLGIDKAYGIRKLHQTLGIAIDKMFFVGDALCPHGEDYPAKNAGVLSIQVRDPDETKQVIKSIISSLDGAIDFFTRNSQ